MTTYQLFIVIFIGTLVGLVLELSIVGYIRTIRKRRKIINSISIRFDGCSRNVYHYTILIKGNEVVDLIETEEPLNEKNMEAIKSVIAEKLYETK